MPPVVLIGIDENDEVACVGLYESIDRARQAYTSGELPDGYSYSTFTPELNGYVAKRQE